MLPTTVRIDKDHPLPRHFQVRQILQEMVDSGHWESGEKIPAETDIAASLGVSKMTVNKAILALTSAGLFYREVGRGTFVVPIVKKVGLSGSYKGVSEAQAVIQVITVTAPELVSDDEYLCTLLLAMRSCVSPVDARILLRHVRGPEYLACWQESGCDGWVVVAPLQEDVPGLCALAEAEARVVVLGACWPEVKLPSIDSDNVDGARLAIDHLTSLGHRHIGLLYAAPDQSNTRDRIEGFRQVMQEADLPVRADWILDVESSEGIAATVRTRLRNLLQKQDRPTAFFAAGPIIACSLLQVAAEIGIAVPRELSIVGFDDSRAITEATPVLTTVRQPLEQMGFEAIACLRTIIEQPGKTVVQPAQKLPCNLLTRDSTASP